MTSLVVLPSMTHLGHRLLYIKTSSLAMYSLDLSTQDSPSAKPKPLFATPVLGYPILLYRPLQALVPS